MRYLRCRDRASEAGKIMQPVILRDLQAQSPNNKRTQGRDDGIDMYTLLRKHPIINIHYAPALQL